MHKIVLIVVTFWLMMGISLSGQKSESDKLYDKLDGAEGVTVISFSKDMISMVDMLVDDEESKHFTGPMTRVRLMICRAGKGDASIEAVNEVLEGRPYVSVEDEGDDDARIYVKRSGRKIKECHVVTDHEEGIFLLSFYGDFRVEDIEKLTEKSDHFR